MDFEGRGSSRGSLKSSKGGDGMDYLLWTLIAFSSGSLMFSHWIGLVVLKKDIRTVGNGNPGAFNLWRAGGKAWSIVGLLLDYIKGLAPVIAAQRIGGIEGAGLIPIAFAPVVGHAFSPWLCGRGGKAIAVTFGVWTGISLWEGPMVFGALLSFWYAVSACDGWTVFLASLCFGGYLVFRGVQDWLVLWFLVSTVLTVKHFSEMRKGWRWRPWVCRIFRRNCS
jgi:acyl phosphate:glycerol-3-phosphate acyltransferase